MFFFRQRSSLHCVKLLLMVFVVLFVIFFLASHDILLYNPHIIGSSLSSFASQESTSDNSTDDAERRNSSSGEARYLTLDFRGSFCCGMSNQIFELVSGIALARRLNRTLYVQGSGSKKVEKVIDNLKKREEIFPNLHRYVTIRQEKEGEKVKHFEITGRKCCVYGNISILEDASAEGTIQLDSPFLQSFKYFENIASEIPTTILRFSETVEKIADEKLFDSDVTNGTDHRLCVHTRRGDFVGSRWLTWSTDLFTAGASSLLAKELINKGKNVSVLLFGNDHRWLEKVTDSAFEKRPPFSVYVANKTEFDAADFAFASKYCHTVLLTAPMSTFGWWMGYLAWKANNASVYRREEHSQPKGIEWEVNPEDFFPPTWKTVKLPFRESELDAALRPSKMKPARTP